MAGFSCGRPPADSVPLDLADTTQFSRSVLQECAKIPFGSIVAYHELAALAGSSRAARAVGQVMRRNPLAPFVPCHRVVGADGMLTGFGGGLPLKAHLLELEGWEVHRGPGEKWRVSVSRESHSIKARR
ncbi:MAG: MGMT family protein [Armatimonadetes bacterium]|nr:MGMT family protein [Armatimonadota bacterium]